MLTHTVVLTLHILVKHGTNRGKALDMPATLLQQDFIFQMLLHY